MKLPDIIDCDNVEKFSEIMYQSKEHRLGVFFALKIFIKITSLANLICKFLPFNENMELKFLNIRPVHCAFTFHIDTNMIFLEFLFKCQGYKVIKFILKNPHLGLDRNYGKIQLYFSALNESTCDYDYYYESDEESEDEGDYGDIWDPENNQYFLGIDDELFQLILKSKFFTENEFQFIWTKFSELPQKYSISSTSFECLLNHPFMKNEKNFISKIDGVF